MVMGRTVLFGLLILVVSVAGGQNKPAVAKAPPTIAASGKQTYMQYCASCHGIDALGEGPAAFVLKTPPPGSDQARQTPRWEIPLRVHLRCAAFWHADPFAWLVRHAHLGPIFGSLDNYNEPAVRKRIKDLSDYLASLQQNES